MLQDDFLLRQISQFTEALAGIRRQFEVDAEDLDATAQLESGAKTLTGMSLKTLDRLPATAIISGLRANPDSFQARARAVAELLAVASHRAALLGDADLAHRRRTRSLALGEAAMGAAKG